MLACKIIKMLSPILFLHTGLQVNFLKITFRCQTYLHICRYLEPWMFGAALAIGCTLKVLHVKTSCRKNAQFLDCVGFNLRPNKWDLCCHLSCMSGDMVQPPSSSHSNARCCAHSGAEILILFSFYSILPLISCEDEADGVWWNMERGMQREENMTVNASSEQWWI